MTAATSYDDDIDTEAPGGVITQTGIHAFVPIWILDPAKYLPGADPGKLTKGDEKPLNGTELRVYIALRSFADRYTGHAKPFVKTIAKRAGVHPHSAEKAIAKFKRLGWLSTKRRYRDDGSIHRCDYYLVDACPTASPEGYPPDGGEGVPANSRVGSRRNGGEGTRESAGAKNTPDEHTNGTQRSELNRPTADAAGAQEAEPPTTPVAVDDNGERANFTDWSPGDLDLFLSLVGGPLVSDGSVWQPAGEHPAETWYQAFRQRGRNPLRWPGAYFEQINNNSGIESYLASQGLEAAW